MAAPHVAGVVALMFSVNPALTPAQVRQALQSTARPFPAGSGCNTSICGAGLLDAAGAVAAVLPPAPTGLKATALGVSSITWTWGATGVPAYAFQPSTGGSAIILAGTSLTQVGLATNTAYGAAVASSTTLRGLLSAFVTGYTLAAPPTSFALVQVNSSSMTVSWALNTNPPANTAYRVDYWRAVGATVSVTAQAGTTVLSSLFGGATYYLSVSALNGDGLATSGGVVLTTVTLPSSATAIGPAGGAVASGPATLRVPAGAYSQGVQVSLRAPASLACGAATVASLAGTDIGLDVAVDPPLQPAVPVALTLSYADAGIGVSDPRRFILARCDEARNTWVPLASTVDPVGRTVTAFSGHLSVFQIMSAAPTADVFQFRIGPNPLRMSRGQRQMGFLGPAGAEIRIHALTGELVRQLSVAANGMASWDAVNEAGQAVASGVYLVFVRSGSQSRTYKVIVER
jgi:hypothetical protein